MAKRINFCIQKNGLYIFIITCIVCSCIQIYSNYSYADEIVDDSSSPVAILPLERSLGVYTQSGPLAHDIGVFKRGGVSCGEFEVWSSHPTQGDIVLDACDQDGPERIWYYSTSDTRPIVEGMYTYRLVKMIDEQPVQIAQLDDYLIPYLMQPASILDVSTNGTMLTASWTTVDGANNYRLRVREISTGETVYQIFTSEVHDGRVTATVPPGILEPNTSGKYYIEIYANHEHLWLETDNRSRRRFGRNDGNVITTGSAPQAPFIENSPGAGVQTWTTPPDKSCVGFWLPIYDAQGGDTIASVTVTLPDGTRIPLYLDGASGPKAEYVGEIYGVPQAGTYRFAVTDNDGNTCAMEQTFNPMPIAAVNATTVEVSDGNQPWRALHEAVITQDSFTVRWESVGDAVVYQVRLFDEWKNSLFNFHVLQPAPGAGQPSLTLPAGIFQDGCSTFVRIRALREYWEDYPDNVSNSQWLSQSASLSFRTHHGSHAPQIGLAGQGAALISHPSATAPQTTEYAFEAWVRVTDEDGIPGNIASVHMLTPSAQVIPLYFDMKESASVGYYTYFERVENPSKFQSGTYTFVVTDHDGNESTVTDVFTNNPLSAISLVKPESGKTFSGNVNVEWLPVTGASGYRVYFYDEWYDSYYRSDFLTEPRYTLPAGTISLPGPHAIRVSAWREDRTLQDLDNFATSGSHFGIHPYIYLKDSAVHIPALQLLLE